MTKPTKMKRRKSKDYVPTVLHKPRDISFENWREENGIPNWTQQSAYPKELSRDQIKWEFLRRNYYYKLLYSDFVDEDGVFHKRRIDSQYEEDAPESEWEAASYELPDLIAPCTKAIDLPSIIFTRHFRGAHINKVYDNGRLLCSGNNKQYKPADLVMDSRFALFVFDLTHPLPYQVNKQVLPKLEKLQARLEATSNIEVLTHDSISRDYRKHLQVLDAYSERAKSVDIGKIVFGAKDDKKARDRADKEFKRALEMWKFF